MAPPVDLLVLLGVLFVNYTLRFFESTRIVPELLELTPLAWRFGVVWQLVTYPLAAVRTGGLWFVLSLLILFWFGRDVFYHLGRKRFWTLLVLARRRRWWRCWWTWWRRRWGPVSPTSSA